MLDNPLISLLIATLKSGLTARGVSMSVKQSNQPRQQGPEIGPAAYITKLSDHRHGFVGRSDVWNATDQVIDHTETQVMESTFQITILAPTNPADTSALTASDLAETCASVLQHESAITAFSAQNVGVLRVIDVRNPYFVDDQDQFRASPSFDIVLTHEQSYTAEGVAVSDFEYRISGV
jgi:hypothetical protein